MKFTNNYNLNLPDLADQYNLQHWNENTNKIDEQLKFCENDIESLQQKHQDDTTAMNTAIAENKTAIDTEKETRIAQDEILSNLISNLSTSLDNSILFGENFIKFTKSKVAVVWGEHENLVTTANIELPFHFANTNFAVFLTSTRNGSIVTSLWEGDENGNKTRDTNRFRMSCKRSSSSAINVAYLVIGTYQE